MVSGRIDSPGSPFSTRDTVETWTPAALAMSTSRARGARARCGRLITQSRDDD